MKKGCGFMEKESNSRQQFSSKTGFLLAAIGSAVGLGNIWRYPYIAFKYGGGSFLVPYFIALITAGVPLLILEYTLGTKYRGATPLVWARLKKSYEWIGWVPTVVAGLIIFYYSAVISWACNYFILSFNKGWGESTGDYFYGNFLHLSDGPLELGGINMPVLIGLFLVWGCCWLVCSRNISKGIEKANKILIPFMCIALLAIVIRGITLPGAEIGLNALFTPDWSAVAKPDVWMAAYGQVFFSLSIAMGIMITYSSYLPKGTELVNTSFVAAWSNSAFEFTAALGVFGILGFKASQMGVPIDEVAKSGPGLAFVAYPEGINMIPGITGNITGVVFFLCLIAAGFTSFISLTEAFSAPFIEKFGVGRKKMYAITCAGGFITSTLIATNAGLYILDIVDYFCNSYGLLITGILEAFVCGWLLKKVPEFVDFNNKTAYIKLGKWWDICVKFILPIMVTVIFVMSFKDFIVGGYEGYPVPALLVFFGGPLAITVIISIAFSKIKWFTSVDAYQELK
jgi:NSS family neurotransmitter:Na+ symporter